MKTKNFILFAIGILCILFVAFSCSKEDYSYNTNSRTLDLGESHNYASTSPAIGKLGRVLFYDNSLSINNSVSCGSCHKQSRAFADEKRFSKGFENLETSRNTPPIQNLNLLGRNVTFGPDGMIGQALFWDGRERVLQNMVVQPIFNHVEMGMRDTRKIVEKVASKPYYTQLFIEAYGDDEVSMERISEALSGFVSSIVSFNTGFDAAFPFGPFTNPNPATAEERGMNLFMGKYNCNSCHDMFSPSGYSEPLDNEFINIGLDANPSDLGRGALTALEGDNGKFRIPNLKNVALTAPYMHDGRFTTLEEVLDHYSHNVASHPNLDDRLKDASGQPLVLNITEEEKKDMIAFLNTLTDMTMTSDPKFSDPFVKR